MSKELDASPEALHIAEEKVQRRLFLRNEFLKQKTDPFAHATGETGTVFDSAFIRFQAMRASYSSYFKPTGKNVIIGIAMMLVPMFGFGTLVNYSRNNIEASYRRGEVAYKDRHFKFA